MKDSKSLILFDGVCTLCNASIDFVMKRDRKNRFLVGALQEPISKKVLSDFKVAPAYLDSLVLLEHGKIYFRSTAALRIAKRLGGLWPALYLFILIPSFVRDPIYDWIGRNRYRWFGKKSTCRIPTAEERSKFLSEENFPY